jgi:hypothetical protein
LKTEDDNKHLSINAAKRAELAHKITSLVPGKPYVLTFQARGNSSTDARVILRNLGNSSYLGNTKPNTDAAWKTQTLKFIAPAPEVGLEISLRSPGAVDLDGFVIEKAR